MKAVAVFVGLFLFLSATWAVNKTDLPSQIGEHYPLFTFEKNENPQNIMVIYTKLNKDCRFLPDPQDQDRPFFDYYWLMDRKKYKPVHPLIKRGIRNRLQLETPPDFKEKRDNFSVRVNDLKKINKTLKDNRIKVSSQNKSGQCEVSAVMNLDPKSPQDSFIVTRIYSETKKTFMPPFREVLSLTLDGINLSTHKPVEKKFIH